MQNHFVVSQVSPYIVPFLPKGVRAHTEGVWSTLSGLALSELRHRLAQVRLSLSLIHTHTRAY
jgi:hypothetical protein